MKVVILAGGVGSRLSEETAMIPKPLVEIGGKPLLWHILKIYSVYGYNDFIISCGYKGEKIKEYFRNLYLNSSDLTIDIKKNEISVHRSSADDWKVTLVDTGLETMTGGRIKNVEKYLDGETFMATYGDGLSNVNINKLLAFHKSHGKKATVTAVRMPRFGMLKISNKDKVIDFQEKRLHNSPFISSGFFVLSRSVLDFIDSPMTPFETTPLQKLADAGELMAYKHDGFFRPLDNLNDKRILEEIWASGKAPWKVW